MVLFYCSLKDQIYVISIFINSKYSSEQNYEHILVLDNIYEYEKFVYDFI